MRNRKALSKRLRRILPSGVASFSHLAERRGFILKPDDPSHIWIGRYHRSESVIASIVAELLDRDVPGQKRRPSRKVTLFPGTETERVETLSDAQYRGVRNTLENRFSILCGPGGSRKTTTIAGAAQACGGRALITTVSACAGQWAAEVTGCERKQDGRMDRKLGV
jgi:hypothetical protein